MAFDANDEETKAAIKKLVSEAVKDSTEGLATKNKELLGELKQARKGQEISPEAFEKVEDENTALKEAVRVAEKLAKTATATAEKSTTDLAEARKASNKLAIDNGIQSAIATANVAPHFQGSVNAMLSLKTSLSDDGGVMVGDKSLTDFVTEWSQSDEGKHYIVAPNSGGGGGKGGDGGGGGVKSINRTEFDSKSASEKMAFTKEGGTVTD